MEIANNHGLIVIEDSAQTMLGTYKGKLAGTLGHIGVFSFENKKLKKQLQHQPWNNLLL